MARDLRRQIRKTLRILILSSYLGLVCGYTAFDAVYPNLAYPPAGEASFPLVIALLLAAALPAGFLTETLPDGVIEVFLALPIGALVGSILSISPVFTGLFQASADVLAYDLIHNGFGVFALAFIVYIVGGIVGSVLRDRFLIRAEYLSDRNRS